MTSPSPSSIPSPWVWIVGDPGEQLIFTVNWDTATGEIMSAIAFRELDCVYEYLYLGTRPYPIGIGETLLRYRDFPPDTTYQTIYDIIVTPVSVGFQQNVNLTTAATLQVA